MIDKTAYDKIEIPEALNDVVKQAVAEGLAKEAPEKVFYLDGARAQAEPRRRSGRKTARRWLMTAACFLLVLASLNLSPALASAAADVPVLGGLFRVLTIVDYSKLEDGIRYDVSVPELEAESALAEKVNAAIQKAVDRHIAKAQQDWNDYRKAFFATGGTEEEWGGREMDVAIDYEIKSQTEDRISFTVSFSEGWVSAHRECSYYNLDLAEDRVLTLRDVLGEDWAAVCDAAIRQQIDERVQEEGFTYFFSPDEGGFTGVNEHTNFYIRKDGAVVVCFPKYEIAAGAAGDLEFVVQG